MQGIEAAIKKRGCPSVELRGPSWIEIRQCSGLLPQRGTVVCADLLSEFAGDLFKHHHWHRKNQSKQSSHGTKGRPQIPRMGNRIIQELHAYNPSHYVPYRCRKIEQNKRRCKTQCHQPDTGCQPNTYESGPVARSPRTFKQVISTPH